MKNYKFDIQRFADSDSNSEFNLLSLADSLIKKLGLMEFVETLKNMTFEDFVKILQENANPILKLIGDFLWEKADLNDLSASHQLGYNIVTNSAKLLARLIEIVHYTNEIRLEIANYKKAQAENYSSAEYPRATISSHVGIIVSDLTYMADAVINLKTSKSNWFVSATAAGLGFVANILAGMDGITNKEKEDIYKSYFIFLKTISKDVVKGFFTEGLADNLINFPVNKILDTPAVKDEFRKQAAEKFTHGGGPFDLIVALVTGFFDAINYHGERFSKYTEEGIPQDIAKHDAFIDALGKFIHGTASTYSKGVDDVIFRWLQGFVSWITKTEVYDPDKNYVEVICDRVKTLSPVHHVVGKKGDDKLLAACIDSDFCYSDDGNDYIGIMAANATIWAGRGDDTIRSLKEKMEGYSLPERNSIFGGPGDDMILLNDKYSTIYGGTGSDKIAIFGTDNQIFGDDGNDIIIFADDANGNTTTGGLGNDIIALGKAENIVIYYENGDGNDTIDGFDENDELRINGDYWSFTRGNDIIVKVGPEGYLLLSQAAGKNIKISGNVNEELQSGSSPEIPDVVNLPNSQDYFKGIKSFSGIRGTEGNDDLRNHIATSKDNLIIQGLGGNDSLVNFQGVNVLMDGGDGNDTIYNTHGTNVIINGGNDNDWINNGGNEVTINGGAGNDTVGNVQGTNVVIDGGDGDDFILTGEGENLTIYGGAGNDEIANYSSQVKIYGSTGNDTIYNEGAQVSITGGAGNDVITDESSGNSVDVNMVNYNGHSYQLFDMGMTWPEAKAYCENLGGHLAVITSAGEQTVIESLLSAGTKNSYWLGGYKENKKWKWITDEDFSYTHWSYKDPDNFGRVEDSLMIYKAKHDGRNFGDWNDLCWNASCYGEYVFFGTKNFGFICEWDLPYGMAHNALDGGDGNDTINNKGNCSQILGGAGNDIIRNNGDNVTISTGDGSDTVELSATVTSVTLTDFAENDVIHWAGSVGVKSFATEADSLVVTLNDNSSVTINGVNAQTADDKFVWSVNSGTASYTKNISSSLKLSKDGKAISFAPATNENIFTISGLNDNLTADELDSLITVDGTKIILSANVLAQKNISLMSNKNYSLELDDDCPAVENIGRTWLVDGTSATLYNSIKTKGYSRLNNKTIVYSAAVGKTLLTVSGLTKNLSADDLNENLTLSGKTLTATADVVGENFSVGSSGYKVVFAAGNYDGSFAGTTGNDNVEVQGAGLTLSAGAGNDTIISSGNSGNVYLFDKNGGKDVVKGYGESDTIKITDDSTITPSLKSSDVIFKVDSATLTLKDAATGKKVTVVNANGETFLNKTFYADRAVDGDWVSLGANYRQKSYAVDEYPNVDASAVTKALTLMGSDANNEIIGGKGSDFINSGGGSNTLTGGKGNDTFIHGGGFDTITDYGVGTNKISLGADLLDYEIDNAGNLTLNVDSGSVTILDAGDKKINFVANGKTTSQIFTADGIYNTPRTAATLASSTETFIADKKLITIDGGQTSGVEIIGNAKNNKIFGGAGNDTLNGSSGTNTLVGGNGSDVFVFGNGKSTVTDYTTADKIFLDTVLTSESINSKGDVVLKIGTNALTVKKFGDDGQTINFIDGTSKTYYREKIVADDGATLLSSFGDKVYNVDGKVDASVVRNKFTLAGGKNNDTIIGGRGANFISGGGGENILIGGKGSDTFVHDTGNDTISDYETSDKISLSAAAENFELSGGDVIINFDSGSLTVQDGVDKRITFVEGGKTRVNLFAAEGIYNGGKTAVTLDAATETFTADKTLVTVDGTAATGALEIFGNTKSNKIFAGNVDTTINGGKGNDSLWGGSGSDKFIYESGGGRDVIYNFGDGDALDFGDLKFTATVKDNAIAFKVGTTSNAVTLKDYTAENFVVNGETYGVEGSTFTKKAT